MGYRLSIKDLGDTSLKFYGTKLYGYCEDLKVLSSYKYLKKLGKITDDTMWLYGCGNEIILTANEFIKFIKLYDFDFKREYGIGLTTCLDYEILNKISNTDFEKEISWG